MKVLITGATGLVGQPLLQALIQKNHSVHYLTTRKGQTQALSGATGFYWNPEKEQIDEECFDGVDCVIHLAGASISQRWTKKNKANILDSRVKSTQLLYQAIKNLGEKNHDQTLYIGFSHRFIPFLRSSSVYRRLCRKTRFFFRKSMFGLGERSGCPFRFRVDGVEDKNWFGIDSKRRSVGPHEDTYIFRPRGCFWFRKTSAVVDSYRRFGADVYDCHGEAVGRSL